MFQSLKRAAFISRQNFSHWNTGDAVRMHLWLQENGWPANEFVDLLMRVYPKLPPQSLKFKFYLGDQYEWVASKDREALERLCATLAEPDFRQEDKKNLEGWLQQIASRS